MACEDEIDLIADKNGNLKHTFGGLLKLSLLHSKEFEAQVYKEIRAQVLFWKSILPDDTPFCIDSHQHTHMIPAVFRALLKALSDEKINLKHMRIPAEPLLPYIQTPSLYFTYKPINIIKQWLLKFLWLINKSRISEYNIPSSYFFGILFSGEMDEKRVSKILPKYKKLAEKNGKNIRKKCTVMPYIEQDKVDAKTREKLEAIIEKSYATFWKQKRLFDIFFATLILLFFILSFTSLSACAFFAAITIPPVFLSIRLQSAGAKELSVNGLYSPF